MGQEHELSIQEFFKAFETSSAAGDVEGLAAMYATAFLAAGPKGAQVVKSSDMLQVIPKRKQMLASIGCESASLVSLHENKLDDRYSLVRTEWRWRVKPAGIDPQDIVLSSTFLIQRSKNELRIVLYLNHADIMDTLRERGWLPVPKEHSSGGV
jgi:hypothetical protein